MRHTLFDRFLSVLAFALLASFLGILLWYVPRSDLGLVVGATLIFVAYDFFTPER